MFIIKEMKKSENKLSKLTTYEKKYKRNNAIFNILSIVLTQAVPSPP